MAPVIAAIVTVVMARVDAAGRVFDVIVPAVDPDIVARSRR